MSDMLATGLSWLGEQLREHASRSVSYQRGSDSVTLSGTKGRSDFSVTDIEGSPILTNVQSFDWIFTTADLVLNAVAALPREGDRIVEDSITYEVHAPAIGLQPWRYTDSHRQSIRVHTKKVA